MEKIIGVIGKGFVGTALLEGMRHAFSIVGYDKQHGTFVADSNGIESFTGNKGWEVDPSNPIKWLVSTCPVIFVCVPTPMKKDGSCDVSIVNSIVKNIYDEEMGRIEGKIKECNGDFSRIIYFICFLQRVFLRKEQAPSLNI